MARTATLAEFCQGHLRLLGLENEVHKIAGGQQQRQSLERKTWRGAESPHYRRNSFGCRTRWPKRS